MKPQLNMLVLKILLTLSLLPVSLAAQFGRPITISPAIGDTLDPLEQQRLGLFPDVDGFQWAVFLLDDQNNSLRAKISSIENGRERLRIITMTMTPALLQRKIELTLGAEPSKRQPLLQRPPDAGTIAKIHNPATDSILIVSPRVGTEIDREERDHFNVFRNVGGFQRAAFFERPDSTYYALVTVRENQGDRDTCLEFSANSLSKFAERIDHYEGLLEGSYKMNKPRETEERRPKEVAAPGKTGVVEVVAPSPADELLPFANLPADPALAESDWGFTFAFSSYSPNFSGAEPALRTVEDSYRAQGYSIGSHPLTVEIAPLIWYSLRVRVTRQSTLLLVTGRSLRDVQFKALSASYLYFLKRSDEAKFRPYVGAGLGHYYVRVGVNYNSNLDGNSYLEEIVIEGGSVGMTFFAGYEYTAEQQIGLSFQAEYLYVPTLNVTVGNAKGEVLLSNMMLKAGIVLFF